MILRVIRYVEVWTKVPWLHRAKVLQQFLVGLHKSAVIWYQFFFSMMISDHYLTSVSDRKSPSFQPLFPPESGKHLIVAFQTTRLQLLTRFVTVKNCQYQVYYRWASESVCRTLGSTRRATTRCRPLKESRFPSSLPVTSTSFWRRYDFKRCHCPCACVHLTTLRYWVFCSAWGLSFQKSLMLTETAPFI